MTAGHPAPPAILARPATRHDTAALADLIERAIACLQTAFLTRAEIRASRSFMGLDTQLIDDGTCLVLVSGDRIVATGSWSRRATLYGGSIHANLRDATLLDPARDAARVRAMYTDPDATRSGLGSRILALCEHEAAAAGFARVELMSTLSGEPLYLARGYAPIERIQSHPHEGVTVTLIRMGKTLRG